jgi:coenzyme Q-binding protein COQ10
MPAHSETMFFPYNTNQLFELVAGVEHYPIFLPWCRASRILSRGDNEFIAELVVCFKNICEQYTSRVSLMPPADAHSAAEIKVELVTGPFHHLDNHWRFEPVEGGTNVHFHLDFAFKTKLLDRLIGGFFTRATEKMVAAFSTRADVLYSRQSPDTSLQNIT